MELLQVLVAGVQLLKVLGQVQDLRGTVDEVFVRDAQDLLKLFDLLNMSNYA